jgi:hypothetical protein
MRSDASADSGKSVRPRQRQARKTALRMCPMHVVRLATVSFGRPRSLTSGKEGPVDTIVR